MQPDVRRLPTTLGGVTVTIGAGQSADYLCLADADQCSSEYGDATGTGRMWLSYPAPSIYTGAVTVDARRPGLFSHFGTGTRTAHLECVTFCSVIQHAYRIHPRISRSSPRPEPGTRAGDHIGRNGPCRLVFFGAAPVLAPGYSRSMIMLPGSAPARDGVPMWHVQRAAAIYGAVVPACRRQRPQFSDDQETKDAQPRVGGPRIRSGGSLGAETPTRMTTVVRVIDVSSRRVTHVNRAP